jgi:3,4-dihydroxy 2-butanone 4-phosphate synthase/GTP cyclohydrolase II
MFENLHNCIDDIKKGGFVIITDDTQRENEADVFKAAQFITKDDINFLVKNARGLITNPISKNIASKLSLNLMVPENAGTLMTAFTVSIDAVEGTHTGISSSDRALTMTKMSDPNSTPMDFERPGHVFPLLAHEKGVLVREGHTEAAIELLKLAGLCEVGVLCETLNEDGDALRGKELVEFSRKFSFKIISVAEIKNYLLSLKSST